MTKATIALNLKCAGWTLHNAGRQYLVVKVLRRRYESSLGRTVTEVLIQEK